MRGKPCSIEPPIWHAPQENRITVKLRNVTPIFGGGYEAREVDTVCHIRPAAIRGQLRFWWRATVGAQFENAQQLFAAEEAVWGSARKKGAVSVQTTVNNVGDLKRCARFSPRDGGGYRALPVFESGWPPYALQAFQGELADRGSTIMREPELAIKGCEFTVMVRFAENSLGPQVGAALSAWMMYGGVGARTRRGCGSLEQTGGDACSIGNATPRSGHSPTLYGSAIVRGNRQADPLRCWYDAVEAYRHYRQGEGFARRARSGNNTPGRSYWPEPDAVRRITSVAARSHEPEHAVQRGFPRADLGLPIIFHFKSGGDPPESTLSGSKPGMERFASPVITKVMAVEGGYVPVVLMLNADPVWQYGPLKLKWNGGSADIAREDMELTQEERSNIRPLSGGAGVRQSLVEFVRMRWNTEIEVLK